MLDLSMVVRKPVFPQSSEGSCIANARAALILFALLLNVVPAPRLAQAEPAVAGSTSSSLISSFQNPLGLRIADPFILRDGEEYYLYGTTNVAGFEVFRSRDLVNWRNSGLCYRPDANCWAKRHFWAPEVVRQGDTYYLFFCAQGADDQRHRICVATGKSPLGPFHDAKVPMFPDHPAIDPHVFLDPETGKGYLYVTDEEGMPNTILGAPLAPSLLELESSFTICLNRSQAWENDWIEAPFVIKHGASYYMTYSGTAWWALTYAIGYATAPSPLGPWKKFEGNPILSGNEELEAPGHNSFAWSPDSKELFLVYHTHAGPWSVTRDMDLDRVRFVPAESGPDLLTCSPTPTTAPQPLASGAAGSPRASSDNFDAAALDFNRWRIYEENPPNWSLDKGDLVIRTGAGDFSRSSTRGRNLFLQNLPEKDFSVRTEISFAPNRNFEQAFLILWRDPDNYLMLSAGMIEEPRIAVTLERTEKVGMSLFPQTFGWPIHLRIDRTAGRYRFYASKDGEKWEEIGKELQTSVDFRYVGLGAWAPDSARELEARFRHFLVQEP